MNSQGSRYRRIPTPKECKCEEFCLQRSVSGDISFSWIAVLRGKVDAYIQLHNVFVTSNSLRSNERKSFYP